MRFRTMLVVLLSMSAVGLLSLPACGEQPAPPADPNAVDWPSYWGPNRDGRTPESDWSHQWGADGPVEVWTADVGTGFSSIAVVDGRVYTMGNERNTDTVWCLDAADGKEIWSRSYPCPAKSHPGPRCTPTVHDGRVYTLSIAGHINCWNAADGEKLWSHNASDFGGKPGGWGYACSPLILGDNVIFDLGPVVAFDRSTGEQVWKSKPYTAGYSSPVAFEFGGETLLAIFNAHGLVILKADDGSQVADYRWKTAHNVNAAIPLIDGDRIFITSGYGTGGALLRMTDDGLKELWKTKRLGSHFASCLLIDGYLYGFNGNVGGSRLTCLEFETGEQKWAERYSGQFILAGERMVIQESGGKLAIATPSPAGYKELAATSVGGGKWWNVAVLSGDRIYCRSHKGRLVCLNVSETQTPPGE